MEVERSIWLRKKTNKLQVHPYKPVSWLPTHQRIYIYIWLRKKTNKLQVHPYKPVSWLPTHQSGQLMSGQPRNRLVRMNL